MSEIEELVGQVWEYIEDGELYTILGDQWMEETGRTKVLNLRTGQTAYISSYAFTRGVVIKRWRRYA